MLRVIVNSTPLIALCSIGRKEIAQIIEDLCKNGFFMDDTVKAMVLKQAGENP